MVCDDCSLLRTEMISQREQMIQWFEMLMAEIQDVKTQNCNIIMKIDHQQFIAADLSNTVQNTFSSKPVMDSKTEDQNLILRKSSHCTKANCLSDQAESHFPNAYQQPIPIVNSAAVIVTEGKEIDFDQLSAPVLVPKTEQEQDDADFVSTADAAKIGFAESSRDAVAERAPVTATSIAIDEDISKVDYDAVSTFQCRQCNYMCADKCLLTLHMRKHRDSSALSYKTQRKGQIKIYTCNECDYQTPLWISITRHSMTHSGEKPFACKLCDYRSSRKDDLRRHNRFKHSGEKPFKCDSCDYRASESGSVNKHWKARHSAEQSPDLLNVKHHWVRVNEPVK